jgi:hypothetical protein
LSGNANTRPIPAVAESTIKNHPMYLVDEDVALSSHEQAKSRNNIIWLNCPMLIGVRDKTIIFLVELIFALSQSHHWDTPSPVTLESGKVTRLGLSISTPRLKYSILKLSRAVGHLVDDEHINTTGTYLGIYMACHRLLGLEAISTLA